MDHIRERVRRLEVTAFPYEKNHITLYKGRKFVLSYTQDSGMRDFEIQDSVENSGGAEDKAAPRRGEATSIGRSSGT
jgi:hypothetical protein